MYKIAAPISLKNISDENIEADLNRFLEYFKNGKIDRVFICSLGGMYTKNVDKSISSPKLKKALEFFKSNGMEVGVWVGGFGHGAPLSHESKEVIRRDYQQITGVMGESGCTSFCPLDENFANDYSQAITHIAELSPDIIMIDDDLRLNSRAYRFGCFCPKHLKEFYSLVGENVPRENIEKLIFTGTQNKYRDAYLDMSKRTLIDFAKKLRAAVDKVNPDIRLGACMVYTTWDFEGTDGVELAKAFAGKTKPFLRGIGAPYHNENALICAIENERMQAYWVKADKDDIEFFNEGDVYPRSRYKVPSKALELYELALCCSGETDGTLKYMFDYKQKIDYETAYIDKHIKNLELHENVKNLFVNKTLTGVRVYSAMHKMRNYDFSETAQADLVRIFENSSLSRAPYLLSRNSIPTCYEQTEYPIAVFGENARYIDVKLLKNGAILDSRAAKILAQRGIDTGLVSAEKMTAFSDEYYFNSEDSIANFNDCNIQKIVCKENAKISSVILPDKSPGVYTYQNDDGLKFMVIAGDFDFDCIGYVNNANSDYYNNYYRQQQLIDGIAYLCGKKLPAVCAKNPNLYMLAAKDDKALSVLMLNILADDITAPVVTLDKEYKTAKFINCNGVLNGDKLELDYIAPYGFAAFELE